MTISHRHNFRQKEISKLRRFEEESFRVNQRNNIVSMISSRMGDLQSYDLN